VVLNVAGMLIVGLAYHNWTLAGESLAIGFPIGEISIWSQPWQAKRAWKQYVNQYGTTQAPAANIPRPRDDGSLWAIQF
jgi:hypothetical protein